MRPLRRDPAPLLGVSCVEGRIAAEEATGQPRHGGLGWVPVTTRRHPRYLSFLLTGGVLGVLTATVLVLVRAEAVERPAVLFFYLSIVLTGLGALLGGAVAVMLDARRRT